MKALIVNCTLKPSPETSNTEALAEVVADKLRAEGVEVSEKLVVATPTWMARPASVIQRVKALAERSLPVPISS